MARRPREYTIKVTHRYVHDPEAVERGLEAWAMFLARHLHELVAQQQQEEAEAGAESGAEQAATAGAEPAAAATDAAEAAEADASTSDAAAADTAEADVMPTAGQIDGAIDPDRSALTRPAARRRRRMRKPEA